MKKATTISVDIQFTQPNKVTPLNITGDGRRSIQASVTATGAQLTANEYMVAHNEGATVRGTFRVRQHTRRRGGRAQTIKAHSRTVNFTLPQRAFAGKSREQINRIEKRVAQSIVNALL